jgi:thiamine-phosphate pyrophosphorylase
VKLSPFYPILDTAMLTARGLSLEDTARAALTAGATIVQFRHKAAFSRGVLAQAEIVRNLCREAGALFVVNDRADIARLLDAGLHLGQTDLPPSNARRVLGPDRVIGFSTHNADQLRAAAAEPVDYLALGPIFWTHSKENPDPVVGLDNLRAWRSLTSRPLVAIGGITRLNSASVLAAGADSVAIISDLPAWL